MWKLYVLIVMFATSACFESNLQNSFVDSLTVEDALKNKSMRLIVEDPVLLRNNQEFDYQNDINIIPTSTVEFSNLVEIDKPIASTSFDYIYSLNDQSAPLFYQHAGASVQASSKEFKSFMGYYHSNVVIDYFKNFIPDFNLSRLTSLKGQSSDPYKSENHFRDGKTIFISQEEGNPGDTLFNHLQNAVYFFEDNSTLPGLNLIHTPHAIYHELGHLIQYYIAPNLYINSLDSGNANQQINAMFEGLSDFITAAIVGHDDILGYLDTNFKFLIEDDYFGVKQNRGLDNENTLTFPKNLSQNIYSSGSVFAATLNDLRKYIQGLNVELKSNCTNCNITRSANLYGNAKDAFSGIVKITLLSLLSIEGLNENFSQGAMISMNNIARAIKAHFAALTDNVLSDEDRDNLNSIFKSRGLISDLNTIDSDSISALNFICKSSDVNGLADSDIASWCGSSKSFDAHAESFKYNSSNGDNLLNNDILVYEDIGWMPYSANVFGAGVNVDDQAFENNVVSPCEAIVVFPNLSNLSFDNGLNGHRKDFYGQVSIKSITGNIESLEVDGELVDDFNTGYLEVKSIGPLPAARAEGFLRASYETNETVDKLIALDILKHNEPGIVAELFSTSSSIIEDPNSSLYQPAQDFYFSRFPGVNYDANQRKKSNLGWVFRAPAQLGQVVEVVFEGHLQFYNSTSNKKYPFVIKQKLQVANGYLEDESQSMDLNKTKYTFCEQ